MKDQLIAIALEAGAAILPLFRAHGDARTKSDGSPVTVADGLAERIILERLAGAFPDIAVVAEESVSEGRVPDRSARFFLVDPLDGTKEFISGSGEFTVNIGLIQDGVPIAGVVLAPALGQLFYGDESGAFESTIGDGTAGPLRPIRIRAVPPAGATIVASRSHRTPETDTLIAHYQVEKLVSSGSSLKFCEVAAGRADLYPRLGRTMEWDTAAADAVLRAAGGMVLTLDGHPLAYGKRDQADDADFANPWFVATGGLALPPHPDPGADLGAGRDGG